MTHLIDKDAVIAEINRVLNSYDPNEITSGRYALVNLRDFIDTLEVKEVKEPADAFIEKACKLLERMVWEVTYEDLEGNSVQHYDKMEFIEDFKNYMKGK